MNNFKIGIENTYTIYKEKDGKKEKLAEFHNVVLDQLRAKLHNNNVRIHSVWFGTGSTEPSESDTKLTSPLWTFGWNYNQVISTRPAYISDNNTWNVECTCKVDATASYVGTVSEVGIAFTHGSSSLILGTHALIRDAEGHPMTITKTDTEKLLIDIHMQFRLSESTGFEWNPWYLYALQGSDNWFPIPQPCAPTLAMLRAYPDLMTGGNYAGTRIIPSVSYNANTHIITCSNGRFGTDNQATQDYINAIGLYFGFNGTPSSGVNYQNGVPAGWWKFPNPDIFPNATLQDMRFGTGDGVTTEFTPPINMWVQNTESIYVDGVLQVRGVDYTCDHAHNSSNLYSLNPSIFCKLRNRIIRTDSTSNNSNMGVNPLKGGVLKVNTNSGDYRRTYLEWDKDHHLEWELEQDPQIPMAADYFQMTSIQHTAGSGQYWKNAIFTISYSNDGEAWTDAGSYTCTSNSTNESHRFDFEETITAQYWRLSIDVSACSSSSLKSSRFYTTGISYLHRNGSPIVFTNAPANGAVITMTAEIDRPMKNENFILDVNPTFQV